MKTSLTNNRGVALIITILMMAIIVVLTLHFNSSMRHELYGAVSSRDNILLGYIAKSGYNLAITLLKEDDPASDSFQDDWALLEGGSALSEALFDGGRFQVKISDLSGRLQINSLVKQDGTYDEDQKDILLRLLISEPFELEPEEAEDIVDNIKDWIDRDDEPTRFGAEASYYQSLEKPYPCANSPLRSISEMIYIRGITGKLLFGTRETPGLKEFITVFGDPGGRININTANRHILLALSEEMDTVMVDEIITYRNNEDNDLTNPNWYKEALGADEDIIKPALITIKSSYFEILSTGIRDRALKELKAVVKRAQGDFTTLLWEVI
ncbi:MAG: type II secretion system minor pseudopilin GspK [Desulfatiglans sp.]|nr:type II secretion system minor pseudopilin GspK [Desulfatiglans sp.]